MYDAYGQIVSMTGDATLQKLNPCTYRGYYYDAETGLYYLQSRYYNPEWGRFINADKTEVLNITNNVKQANLYIYAENNPINYIKKLTIGMLAFMLCRRPGSNRHSREGTRF